MYAWWQTFPDYRAGGVPNGDFQHELGSGRGLHWRTRVPAGAQVARDLAEFVTAPASLRVDFDGRENLRMSGLSLRIPIPRRAACLGSLRALAGAGAHDRKPSLPLGLGGEKAHPAHRPAGGRFRLGALRARDRDIRRSGGPRPAGPARPDAARFRSLPRGAAVGGCLAARASGGRRNRGLTWTLTRASCATSPDA
jgi:hypothetical protein